MINMSKKYKTSLSICIILILTSLFFSSSLKNSFVNIDDDFYVINNPVIKSISIDNIKKIFVSFFMSNYQPLTILSYSLDYHFFKLNPFGYHLTNFIFHLFNCLLVFWLIMLLGKRIFIALIAAVLFGVHPLHVESVAWISERKDVLYAFFFLAAMISYLYYLRTSHLSKYYYFSMIFFILSLLSKAMAITLPLVFLLFDYFVPRGNKKLLFVDKIPFFILSFIFGYIAVFAQYSTGAVRQCEVFNIMDKILVVNLAIIFYLSKILVPIKLSCLYPYAIISGEPLALSFLLSSFFVVIIGFVVFLFRRFSKKVIFSSLFFLITVLPVLQFIPIGMTIVADRYTYIPSIGIFYGIGECLLWFCTKKIKYQNKTIISFSDSF